MDSKVYTTTNKLTSSKKIKLFLLMVLVGFVVYILPPRHGQTSHVFNLICALIIVVGMFYIIFLQKSVTQISINPAQNKIETLRQNGLNQQSIIVQQLSNVTTEYFYTATRSSKKNTLVIKDQKNIVRIADNEGFTSATLVEIKQTIDGYKPKP